MDDLERALIAELRRDARASIATLAARLQVTRSTVRARMTRLEEAGEILGYSVVTRSDRETMPLRGLCLVEIEGRAAERITRGLARLAGVDAVHTTNGRWDLIVEISAEAPAELDDILKEIRLIDGVARSETSLLLRTHGVRQTR